VSFAWPVKPVRVTMPFETVPPVKNGSGAAVSNV